MLASAFQVGPVIYSVLAAAQEKQLKRRGVLAGLQFQGKRGNRPSCRKWLALPPKPVLCSLSPFYSVQDSSKMVSPTFSVNLLPST